MAAEELFLEWPVLFWQANRALTYASHGGINTFGERLDWLQGGLEDNPVALGALSVHGGRLRGLSAAEQCAVSER
jgi:hypothetical protein